MTIVLTYIVVKGRISVTGNNAANRRNKKLTFKNNASFRSCTSKINNTFIDNALILMLILILILIFLRQCISC